jgi:hypothetical protein
MVSAGLFSIGLDTYWNQFAGLRDRLLGDHGQISATIETRFGCRVVDAGLVDTPAGNVRLVPLPVDQGKPGKAQQNHQHGLLHGPK